MVLDGGGTNERININVQGRMLEQIEGYSYLGSWIDRGGKCDKEARRRRRIVLINIYLRLVNTF